MWERAHLFPEFFFPVEAQAAQAQGSIQAPGQAQALAQAQAQAQVRAPDKAQVRAQGPCAGPGPASGPGWVQAQAAQAQGPKDMEKYPKR